MNYDKVPEEEVKVFDFNSEDGIIGLMDCGGSNLVKINEDIPNIVKIIGTSKVGGESKARERANEFNVPLVELDFSKFEKEKGVEKGDYFKALINSKKIKSKLSKEEIIKVRSEVCDVFKKKLKEKLKKNNISDAPVFAAGFMSLLSPSFVKDFFILNVHPGDLIYKEQDKRVLVGDAWRPSAKAIMRKHDKLYSSIHLMTPEMDEGPVLMRGYGLELDYNKLDIDIKDDKILKKAASAAQEALKHLGDHLIAGAAFQDLFEGKWGMHKSGILCYKFKDEWHLVPDGIMIEEHIENNPETKFQRSNDFIQEKVNDFYESLGS